MAPGSLSRSHAQLLTSAHHSANHDFAIDSENRCVACHSDVDGSVLATAAAKQSELCLNCHRQEMPDATHGSPHDLHGKSLEELISRGDRTQAISTWSKLVGYVSIGSQDNPTECSQCHREHQGETHDLKEMDSQRCQACHRNSFQSFATDHPEFRNYPYGRTKSIEFDHVKHRDLHYTKKGAKFDCQMCHVQSDQVGAVGQVFRSVPFEQACASCHTQPIKSSIQDGLIVLQIPSVNCNELRLSSIDIGNWPKHASQLTDGVIPPVMRMLIESEPGGAELLNALPTSGRLVDLDIQDAQGRATLLKLTAMTKQLFRKLANEGQPGFRSSIARLIATTGSATHSNPWLDQLANGVPPDLFRAAWNEWFESEGATPVIRQSGPKDQNATRLSPVRFSSTFRLSDPPEDDDLLGGSGSLLNPSSLLESQASDPTESPGFKDPKTWDQLAFGGWMIDRQRMAIVYVPKGHADQWLARWIELEEMRSSAPTPLTRIDIGKQCRQCHALQPALNDHPSTSSEPPRPSNWTVAFRQANSDLVGDKLLGSSGNSDACWKSKKRAVNLREITKFDHTPHLTLPSISDCRSCHQLLDSSPSQSAKNEFAPMQKSHCASCHQKDAAGDSCTQCHNYHVGNKGWSSPR